jgi:hypothetical protein
MRPRVGNELAAPRKMLLTHSVGERMIAYVNRREQ